MFIAEDTKKNVEDACQKAFNFLHAELGVETMYLCLEVPNPDAQTRDDAVIIPAVGFAKNNSEMLQLMRYVYFNLENDDVVQNRRVE